MKANGTTVDSVSAAEHNRLMELRNLLVEKDTTRWTPLFEDLHLRYLSQELRSCAMMKIWINEMLDAFFTPETATRVREKGYLRLSHALTLFEAVFSKLPTREENELYPLEYRFTVWADRILLIDDAPNPDESDIDLWKQFRALESIPNRVHWLLIEKYNGLCLLTREEGELVILPSTKGLGDTPEIPRTIPA